MDKPAIKKMLVKQIKVIITVETAMAINRWKRAKALSEMHSMVNWDKSPYKSFRRFMAQEFPNLEASSTITWVVNYNQMRKWYTWTQIQLIAKKVSYSRAVRTQQSMNINSKISLAKFIKLAEKFRYVWGSKTTVPSANKIILTMPALYIAKLESVLVNYGYRIPKSQEDPKIGISDAMVKYLDTV